MITLTFPVAFLPSSTWLFSFYIHFRLHHLLDPVAMFVFRRQDLPAHPVFPADLEKLGQVDRSDATRLYFRGYLGKSCIDKLPDQPYPNTFGPRRRTIFIPSLSCLT